MPTEDIGTVSGYIQEYGPFVVILAVFLIILLILVIYILNSNKKYLEHSEKTNEAMLTTILDDYFKKNEKLLEKNNKNYDERDIVNIYIKLNKTLKTACENTMRKTNSDRTAVYVFHNGSAASHGLPFFKMTCVSEMISKQSNANIKIADHTAIPLNLFDSIVSGLYDNSEYRISVDKTNNPSDLIFLKNTKIRDCFFVPIYDENNNMMGFIFNGYNTYDPNRDIKNEKNELIDLAMTAKPVIEFSKFQEYKFDNSIVKE